MIAIDRYRVEELVFESEKSLIYRGVRESDDQRVIIKYLKREFPTQEQVAHFKYEYNVLKKLSSPLIVEPIELMKSGNSFSIVFKDRGGSSIKSYLREGGRFDLKEFLQLAIKIADAIGVIHKNNIIHKDINPSNIIWNRESGDLQIIDFELSTMLMQEKSEVSNLNILEGTLAYISPEQTGRMDIALNYLTDFYSLGVTFYEMLLKELPFDNTDSMELVHAHIAKRPFAPHLIEKTIPRVVSNIIMKLMEKVPEERYQSAYGLKYDLNRCLEELNGKGEIVDFSIGSKDISTKFQIPHKLYGREKEIKALLYSFEEISRGSAKMVMVAGYSGIGKSSLVQVIRKSIIEKRGYFIKGKFDMYKRDIPYNSIIQALGRLIQQILTEDRSKIVEWRKKIISELGGNARLIIDIIPELELIIGTMPPVIELPAEEARNRFHLTFEKFIRLFPGKEHPLVIFLDDLQWADAPSLSLLELIMNDENSRYLMIVGAYRSNEVKGAHPMMLTLESIGKKQVIDTIHLKELGKGDINRLIADTLFCSVELAEPLSSLILSKTGGNPFFVNQFLQTLYQEQLLYFNSKDGLWEWDIEKIKKQGITDNVIVLMSKNIKKYSHNTIKTLIVASAMGNTFDLNTLSRVLDVEKPDISSYLWEPMKQGLITPLNDSYKFIDSDSSSNVYYQFLHDRIRQAIYTLVKEKDKMRIHLKLGRAISREIDERLLEENIFAIVNHYNQALELIKTEGERLDVAKLNLMAGKKAKASSAYEPAFNCLASGISMLPEDSWSLLPELTFNLYTEAAEAAYLCGEFEKMEELARTALNSTTDSLDQVKIFLIKIRAYIARNDFEKTKRTGLTVLKMLGVKLPYNPNKGHVLNWIAKTKLLLSGKNEDKIVNLPDMDDPYKREAMKLMAELNAVFIQTDSNLFLILILLSIHYSIKYGNTLDSISAYAGYAIILCGVLNDIEGGYKFGTIASRLLEKYNAKKYKVQPYVIINNFIRPWKEPLGNVISTFLEAYNNGVENGDFTYAATAIVGYCNNAFIAGFPLDELYKKINSLSQSQAELKQESMLNIKIFWKNAISSLLKFREDEDSFFISNDGEGTDLKLEEIRKKKDYSALANYYLIKQFLTFFYENYHEAQKTSLELEKYLQFFMSTVAIPQFYFIDSLIHLTPELNKSKLERTKNLKRVKAAVKKMSRWASYAPANFTAKQFIIQAELERLERDQERVCDYYQKAIDAASKYGVVHEEGLANELFAKYWLEKGNREIARVYMLKARFCYSQWGAKGKLEFLDNRYPDLSSNGNVAKPPIDSITSLTSISTATSTTASHSLDLFSIIKASNIISEEIKLEELLRKMMDIVIENIGAQRGVLLLETCGEYFAEVERRLEESEVKFYTSTPVVDFDSICQPIVQYVMRTGRAVVLKDAQNDDKYGNDHYIKSNGIKSLMCSPLINQGKQIGIFYFENNLLVGAFTESRMEILRLLSSQIAISIDNARLYDNLEQKVEERTRLLMEEKEKTDQLLLNILPTKVARDLREYGKSTPEIFENVTVFFSDVVNFTTISSELDPHILIDELNDIFTAMDLIFEKNSCERIKTIGDAYLSVCGMPEKNDEHAYNVIKSSLEIVQYLTLRNENSQIKWQIRIGIHSGKVVGGVVGIKKYIYDVFGDSINTAARMESSSEPMKINISHTSYELVKERFIFNERESIDVKGKGMMKMYFVEDIKQ